MPKKVFNSLIKMSLKWNVQKMKLFHALNMVHTILENINVVPLLGGLCIMALPNSYVGKIDGPLARRFFLRYSS